MPSLLPPLPLPKGFYTERGGNCKPAPPGTKVARTGLCNAERW